MEYPCRRIRKNEADDSVFCRGKEKNIKVNCLLLKTRNLNRGMILPSVSLYLPVVATNLVL